jgi:hypothetical protein
VMWAFSVLLSQLEARNALARMMCRYDQLTQILLSKFHKACCCTCVVVLQMQNPKSEDFGARHCGLLGRSGHPTMTEQISNGSNRDSVDLPAKLSISIPRWEV